MSASFDGRVVVVTGAASGIGRAVARAFHAAGARVHLADLDASGVRTAAAELGPEAVPHVVDCADFPAVSGLARTILDRDRAVDILVNNAGIVGGGPVDEWSLDQWIRVMGVDYWGVVHGLHAFVPGMLAKGCGHVVNVASMAGLVGMPLVAPYCAAKFAVVGLSESLRPELAAHGVHLSCVCPGMVRTGVYRSARLSLPGDWGRWIDRFVDRFGAGPEAVAADVLDAVEHRRGLVVSAGGWMAPLWGVRRLSPALWNAMLGAFTGWAIRSTTSTSFLDSSGEPANRS